MEEMLQPDIALAKKSKRLYRCCLAGVAINLGLMSIINILELPNAVESVITSLSIIPCGSLIILWYTSRIQYWYPCREIMYTITENITKPLERAKQILYRDTPKPGEQLVALIYLSDVYKYLNIPYELHADMTLEAIRSQHSVVTSLSQPRIDQAIATKIRFQQAWKSV